MLAATLEQERKKVYQAGRKAGKAEGKAEGRAETQRQTIGQLLHFRFELPEADQAKYTQQVARIQKLQHLAALIDILLNKASGLEDFTQSVTKYLSADKVV